MRWAMAGLKTIKKMWRHKVSEICIEKEKAMKQEQKTVTRRHKDLVSRSSGQPERQNR